MNIQKDCNYDTVQYIWTDVFRTGFLLDKNKNKQKDSHMHSVSTSLSKSSAKANMFNPYVKPFPCAKQQNISSQHLITNEYDMIR